MEITSSPSVVGQPTKAVSAQTCNGVFPFGQCLIQFLPCLFFRTSLLTAADHSLKNTGLEYVPERRNNICLAATPSTI
jgi:hypothetical protein